VLSEGFVLSEAFVLSETGRSAADPSLTGER